MEGADVGGIIPTLEGDAEATVEDVPDVDAAGWTGLGPSPTMRRHPAGGPPTRTA